MIIMAKKKIGISRDLIIHPGETILDLIEERGIKQAELAVRTGVSAAYVSKVISGEKDISASYATKLEYALGVSKKFWLRLQANYDAELQEYNEKNSIDDSERIILRELDDIVLYIKEKYTVPEDMSENEYVIFIRKVLQISRLTDLEKIIPKVILKSILNENINTNIVGAWICLCLNAGDTNIDVKFSNADLRESVIKLKDIISIQKNDRVRALDRLIAYYKLDAGIKKQIYKIEKQDYPEMIKCENL